MRDAGSKVMKNPDGRRFSFISALFLAALTVGPQAVGGLPQRPEGQTAALPSFEEMETNLLSAVNKERASRNLPVLRSAPALVRLARRHSEEMARLDVLSHESASGKSFTERLTDAVVTFAANGENVARSGTYDAGRIHQSFMESPGHRENVLHPEFDEVGIGIVRGAGNTYYVTEDFIRSLVRVPDSEVRAAVLGVLNEARARAGRPPVVEVGEIRRTAEVFVRNSAAGKASPSIPSFFGPTLMRTVIAQDLDRISAAIRVKGLERYGRAGIGVEFSRTREYPGGAYFVCALLVEDTEIRR